jgi:hypothetical protein
MGREIITRIGPVCRFGPGGDFTSVWPAGGELVESADLVGQPKNTVARLLNVLIGLIEALRGSPDKIENPGIGKPIKISKANEQRWLFADDRKVRRLAGHKTTHNIRAYKITTKKRNRMPRRAGLTSASHTLFDSTFKDAKTA